MNKQKGFTLMEIIVAMFVFSILSIIMVMGMQRIFSTRDAIQQQLDNLGEIQITMLTLRRDLEQVIDRPVNNTQGKTDPSFLGDKNSITFTRSGYVNPFGLARRSTMQRISYSASGTGIERTTWPVLDQTPDSTSDSEILSDQVQSISFRYMDEKGKYTNIWPPKTKKNQSTSSTEAAFPKAIIVTLQLPQGELRLLIPVQATSLASQQSDNGTSNDDTSNSSN